MTREQIKTEVYRRGIQWAAEAVAELTMKLEALQCAQTAAEQVPRAKGRAYQGRRPTGPSGTPR